MPPPRTGVATRVATEEAGSIATKATNASTAMSSIASKAAGAAAGAYEAMAGIPIVGPVLGAAAAAATFAAVIAYQSFASAEGGWDRVPHDGAMTLLHKNEMVLSARYAEPLREMLAGPRWGAPMLPAYGVPSGFGVPAIQPSASVSNHHGASMTNNTYSPNITMRAGRMSRGEVEEMLRDHQGAFTRMVNNAVRNGTLRN